jgi:adenylate kinase
MYVDFTLLAAENGATLLTESGQNIAITEFVVNLGDIGPEDAKRKASKKRDEDFEKGKLDKKQLRKLIENAISPAVEKAKVVAVVDKQERDVVKVVPGFGEPLTVLIPPKFDAAEVTKVILDIVKKSSAEAIHIQKTNDAAIAMERARMAVAKAMKRRREDELLLLLM